MTDAERKELSYHLRELPADMRSIRSDLEAALGGGDERSVRGGWTGAWGLLEHDLEVHLPRALELLGAKLPPAEAQQRHHTGDAAVRATIAREARQLIEAAYDALPADGSEPQVAVDKLTCVARLVQAAFALTAEVVEAREAIDRRFSTMPTIPTTMSGGQRSVTGDERDELRYRLQELSADLSAIRSDLGGVAGGVDERPIPLGWEGPWVMLEHDLEVHLPRALELLGATLPPAEPRQGRRAGDAANHTAIAREARRLVEAAYDALPADGSEPQVAIDKLTRVARLVQAAFALTAEVVEARAALEPPDPDDPDE